MKLRVGKKLIEREENVKKLVIILVLVAVLIGGALGGTALAASKPTGSAVYMNSDGDRASPSRATRQDGQNTENS